MHADTLIQRITAILASLHLPHDGLVLDLPPDLAHGDYTTNIAMRLSKAAGKPPLTLAREIADLLTPDDLIARVEVLPPGYINVFLQPSILLAASSSQLAATSHPQVICVEYTDPNPFKEFHIGHLYSNAVGESIARLQEEIGHDVYRLCYQGDVGLHVACSVYGMVEKLKMNNEKLKMIADLSLSERVRWLGSCYAYGATANKEDPAAAEKIKALNAQIFAIAQEMNEENEGFVAQVDYKKFVTKEVYPHHLVREYYATGKKWTLEYFEEIYRKLGTHSQKADAQGAFDHYYFESEVAEYGYTTVQDHLKKGLFEVGEGGAIVSSKERNGLHTRVFVNALGLPTYEAKELGLNPEKYKKYKFDRSIIVTASEINEYFKVLLWNLCQIDPYVGKHTTHVGHGVVRLPEGKMSSRTGKIKSGESLIEEATKKVRAKSAEQSRENPEHPSLGKEDHALEDGISDAISTKIALAAIKYSLLRTNIGRDVIFDIDESLSFEGDSGPYLLYTIVRCQNIVTKSKVKSQKSKELETSFCSQLVARSSQLESELSILRLLSRYTDIIKLAATQLKPHIVCSYLHTLASAFSSYYATTNILKTEDEDLRALRLWLVTRVADTLSRGVHVLGFETVERM